MRRATRLSVFVCAAAAVTVLTVQASPMASATTVPPQRFYLTTLVDYGCTVPGAAKPTTIILACGDGNAVAEHLRWQRWGLRSASGTGVLRQNDCIPDCAGGSFHTYPATLALSETVPAGGHRYFTRVTIRFTGAVPVPGQRVESVKDCYDHPPASYLPRCPPDLQGAG